MHLNICSRRLILSLYCKQYGPSSDCSQGSTLIRAHNAGLNINKCGSRGGDRGSGPPWKITSYMGFYREQALDPPLENVGRPLENVGFLWNWPFDYCKISWGLKKKKKKKKKVVRTFFVWLTWTPPWRKFLDPRMIKKLSSLKCTWICSRWKKQKISSGHKNRERNKD